MPDFAECDRVGDEDEVEDTVDEGLVKGHKGEYGLKDKHN